MNPAQSLKAPGTALRRGPATSRLSTLLGRAERVRYRIAATAARRCAVRLGQAGVPARSA
jgi:hypothetical protein